MGCWVSKDEPCKKCFGCWGLDPASITSRHKLLNTTVIMSICIFGE